MTCTYQVHTFPDSFLYWYVVTVKQHWYVVTVKQQSAVDLSIPSEIGISSINHATVVQTYIKFSITIYVTQKHDKG